MAANSTCNATARRPRSRSKKPLRAPDFAAIAAACGLARVPVGALRERPLGRRLFQRAVQEAVDVARARGIPLADDETAQVVAAIEALPPGTKPSFLLDLESGRPTELDVLSGAVSRYADDAGISAPVHDAVTAALADNRPS